MKIRTGFVSNSSSSSFCMLGIRLEESGLDEKYNTSLDYEYGISDYEGEFIGLNPIMINEDETIKQAKQRIVDTIIAAGGNCKLEDIGWWIDGGYNG